MLKWQFLTFWNQLRMIWRKIRVEGKLIHFNTVEYPQWKFLIRLPMWSKMLKFIATWFYILFQIEHPVLCISNIHFLTAARRSTLSFPIMGFQLNHPSMNLVDAHSCLNMINPQNGNTCKLVLLINRRESVKKADKPPCDFSGT